MEEDILYQKLKICGDVDKARNNKCSHVVIYDDKNGPMLQLDFGGCCDQLVMKSSSFKWRITASRKYGVSNK
jgi:hypothetical protein